MTNQFVLANIIHRPIRALASVLAISLEVLMILMVVGVCSGMVADSAERQQGIGADIFLQPPNASAIFSIGNVFMPIADQEKILQIPGIQAVTPILSQLQTEDGLVTIFGIDLQSFNEVSGGFIYLEGGPFSGPTASEIIIDDLEAQSKRLKVGDYRDLKGRSFKVCGVVRHGKGARVFVPIEAMQDLLGGVGKASMMLIKCGAPRNVEYVLRSIEKALPGYAAFSVQDWVTRIMNTRPPVLDLFINTVVTVAVVIGSFAIFLSLYTTIAERTRDIGILKSLGASKAYIMSLILRESVALCLIGLVLGLLLTVVARSVLQAVFPTLQVLLSFPWAVRAGLLVLTSGALGALYPAFQAASKDPVRALAYE